MATPIQNDSSRVIQQDGGLRGRKPVMEHRSSESQAAQQGGEGPSVVDAPEPDVARAAHLFSAEVGARAESERGIRDEQEARSVVDQLKEMMSANPSGALAAFGRASSEQASAVLGQAPVS